MADASSVAELEVRHATHIFPYYLGKSREESKRSILGRREERGSSQWHFGDPNLVSPDSNPLINRLYNMATLSPDLHACWGFGYLILEPLTAESTTLELKSRFQWTPKHQAADGATMGTLPSSLEASPKPNLVVNVNAWEFINGGYIVTLRTSDPIKMPLRSLELCPTSAKPFSRRSSHGRSSWGRCAGDSLIRLWRLIGCC